jgi:hypothetical protein
MKKHPVVLSALAAALSLGAADVSAKTESPEQNVIPQATAMPAISAEARDVLFDAATALVEQHSDGVQVARGKFKLFDNGPTFVQSVRKKGMT